MRKRFRLASGGVNKRMSVPCLLLGMALLVFIGCQGPAAVPTTTPPTTVATRAVPPSTATVTPPAPPEGIPTATPVGQTPSLPSAEPAATPTTGPTATPISGPPGVPTPQPVPPPTSIRPAAPSPMPTPTLAPTTTPTPSPMPRSTTSITPVVTVQAVVTGLEAPWAVDFAPDGRIFITERPGRVRIVKDGRLDPNPWATLDVAHVSEAGLLGLALSPGFAQDRFVYVAYTYRTPAGQLQNQLVRLRDDPTTGKGVVDKVLLDGVLGSNNHDGGRVKFGPDGKLYWTMGEAERPPLSQDLTSLNGKILRLNPDGSIPTDNPFPGSYVFSYGHRNPQGIAWQPGTGRLYETEHGPSGGSLGCCQDEVNFVERGKNYGWPTIKGDQTQEGMVAPILHSGLTNTWAPSGATFATQGPWAGSFLFVGLRGQALFRLTLDPGDPRKVLTFEPLFERRFGRLRDVVEGPDGAVYILTSNRDGRGSPVADDDRLLKVTVE